MYKIRQVLVQYFYVLQKELAVHKNYSPFLKYNKCGGLEQGVTTIQHRACLSFSCHACCTWAPYSDGSIILTYTMNAQLPVHRKPSKSKREVRYSRICSPIITYRYRQPHGYLHMYVTTYPTLKVNLTQLLFPKHLNPTHPAKPSSLHSVRRAYLNPG